MPSAATTASASQSRCGTSAKATMPATSTTMASARRTLRTKYGVDVAEAPEAPAAVDTPEAVDVPDEMDAWDAVGARRAGNGWVAVVMPPCFRAGAHGSLGLGPHLGREGSRRG